MVEGLVEAVTSEAVEQVIARICEADSHYADPGKYLGYGTAGYRAKATLLPRCFFRVGLVVAMRARCTGRMGVMVTASHNHHADNGVKIVERDGSMLIGPWESFSELIVNSKDLAKTLRQVQTATIPDLVDDIDGLFGVRPINKSGLTPMQHVIIGYDTRGSCAELVAAIKQGLDCFGVNHFDEGLLTTPQLHFKVAEDRDSATAFAHKFLDFMNLCGRDQKANYES